MRQVPTHSLRSKASGGAGASALRCHPHRRAGPDRLQQCEQDQGGHPCLGQPGAAGKVAQLAARLRQARGAVTVVGHTDSVGTPVANLALSLARAQTVRAALLKGLTGRAVQVVASGRGELAPVAPNMTGGKDNPDGRAKNRRGVISFR